MPDNSLLPPKQPCLDSVLVAREMYRCQLSLATSDGWCTLQDPQLVKMLGWVVGLPVRIEVDATFIDCQMLCGSKRTTALHACKSNVCQRAINGACTFSDQSLIQCLCCCSCCSCCCFWRILQPFVCFEMHPNSSWADLMWLHEFVFQ